MMGQMTFQSIEPRPARQMNFEGPRFRAAKFIGQLHLSKYGNDHPINFQGVIQRAGDILQETYESSELGDAFIRKWSGIENVE